MILICVACLSILVSGDEITLVDWREIQEEVASVLAHCSRQERILCQTQAESGQRRLCDCLERCEEYGDCCLDYDKGDYRNTNIMTRWMCKGTKIGGINKYYYMIGHCPAGYTDKTILERCSKQVTRENYTYHLDIPVSSSSSGRVYVNIFCAICNDDHHHLYKQEVGITCDNEDLRSQCGLDILTYLLRNGSYVQQELRWDTVITPGVEPNNCTTQYYVIKCRLWLRKPLPHARPCDAYLTRECTKWPYLPDSHTCQLYKLPVIAADGSTYHNPHCAACNGQDMNTTTCYSPPRYLTRPILITVFPALTVLLDYDGCGPGQFYDSLANNCYSLSCGFRYQNIGGRCIKRQNISMDQLQLDNQHDCFMIQLFEWEVDDESNNGSIIHKETKKSYDIGEYEIYHLDGKDIYRVCSVTDPKERIIKFNGIQAKLSTILTTVSLIFLFLHIVIYSSLKKLRNQPSQNLLSLVCSLFVGQFLFFYGFDFQDSHTICSFVATTSHYFILVSFFCMNVMSYDICRTFLSYLPFHASKIRFKIYSYYAWGTPLVIVVAANLVDNLDIFSFLESYKPMYATKICWLNNKLGSALFFVLPVGALLLQNFLFFLLTLYGIYSNDSIGVYPSAKSKGKDGVKFAVNDREQKRNLCKTKINFLLYLKLSTLMGLAWMFGLLASILDLHLLWYPFIVFNSLQGTFIFIFFDIKWKVYYAAYEKLLGKPHPDRKSNRNRRVLNCMKYNLEEKEESMCSNSFEREEKSALPFQRKAFLLTKILKWKKPKSRRRKYEKNMNEEISNYNAWQQLKMFQEALNEEGDEIEGHKKCRGSTLKLTRQKQVDIPDKNQNNNSPLEFVLQGDTTQENMKSSKKKMMKKQRKKKIGNLKKCQYGALPSTKCVEIVDLPLVDEDDDPSLPPPPYRHPPPYQSSPYKRRMSFTTIIQQTIYEDGFEEVSGYKQNFANEQDFPGPIIELASSSDNSSDTETAV